MHGWIGLPHVSSTTVGQVSGFKLACPAIRRHQHVVGILRCSPCSCCSRAMPDPSVRGIANPFMGHAALELVAGLEPAFTSIDLALRDEGTVLREAWSSTLNFSSGTLPLPIGLPGLVGGRGRIRTCTVGYLGAKSQTDSQLALLHGSHPMKDLVGVPRAADGGWEVAERSPSRRKGQECS